MSSQYRTWQEYQEATAKAFRELGCRAEVQRTITGARGATTSGFGWVSLTTEASATCRDKHVQGLEVAE